MGCFGYNNYRTGNRNVNNVAGASDENSIARFLRTLSPGTPVVIQYDDQKPAHGIFEGFQNGNLILSRFNGFPGLTRVNVNSVNAVSVGGRCHD
ncbi:hypothetical protein P6P90_02965 [Ectobacillus antri]|jgi:hypothetical protein|uniref:Uncharacterized protein n=1 Tax=Ectobacillus antri TaxID=2486280 RepID=A0ABT6H2V6_9BACI|nr:hypothetical protein [Ectobacillus antri]MDG4656285.1 hypothetical protein [Ectobacillus antri]MDG5752960.1 hypothetical protein [Ectobacillus antri]